MLQKQSEAFHMFLWHFFQVENNFIVYRSSKVSDCIYKIHQLWQSGFSRVYSNCCCSCSFEAEILKIGQSSHKMYSNKILNFQESTTILNAHTKKVWKHIICTSYAKDVAALEEYWVSLIHHLHSLDKSIWSNWIVPHVIAKLLTYSGILYLLNFNMYSVIS